ncbi:MAG TPA: DMT family transporter [Candidatus Binatus sp.]|nr:DMT family transporter [Candidatus Binatus sp.]
MRREMSASDWAMLALLAAIWGGSFLCYRLLAPVLAPSVTVFARVTIAAIALLPLLASQGMRAFRERDAWVAFAVMGALNNMIPFVLLAWAETRISAGLASILNATTPMLSVIVAHVAGQERLRSNRVLGPLCGLVGVGVLLAPDLRSGFHANGLAQLAVLGASLSYAVAGVFARRFSSAGIDPLTATVGQLCAAAALSTLLVLRAPADVLSLLHLQSYAWMALLFLALPATSLAYILYFRLIARAGATNALLVTLLVPASAVVLGALALGERLQMNDVAGMAVILAGLVITDGRIFAVFTANAAWKSEPDAAQNPAVGNTSQACRAENGTASQCSRMNRENA